MSDDIISKTVLLIFGTILGALISRYINKEKEKVSLLFDFHREWNSFEMSKHRRKSDKFIQRYPSTDFSKLAEINEDEAISTFVVMRFFQRLWQSIKYNQVKKDLVPELFFEGFYYWYYLSYETNLIKHNWEIAEQMIEFSEWFKKNVSATKHNNSIEANKEKLQDRISKLSAHV